MKISKEIEDKMYSITKILVIDHLLQLGEDKYAVIHRPKAIDGRAWTYSIVNESKVEESLCQFEDYVDMLIHLSIHVKIGREDETMMNAVNLLIMGCKGGMQ